jgi:hypothetical protein
LPYAKLLNPQDARLFRITHIDNVPWMLDHGLHCRSAERFDPDFVSIGAEGLIDKRSGRRVPLPPGGTLSDYVPFYFTPWSMMLLNIKSGRNGVTQRPNQDIVIVGALLPQLRDQGCRVLFTDGHAYMVQTRYFDDPDRLDQIDWPLLQRRDFAKDENDIDKSRRYQAEALIHGHVPLDALAAIA